MVAPLVFDRRLVRLRRDRAAVRVGEVGPILENCALRLMDRLDDTTRRFSRALDIGGRGAVAPLLIRRGIAHVVSTDISAPMVARAGGLSVAADEEWLPFAPASFDLVVASMSLHWVNDLPGAIAQIRRAMMPDGLFLASLPGRETLAPLRSAFAMAETELRGGVSPRVAPFPDLHDAAALLQRAGFALPVADREQLPLDYLSTAALFRDLRDAGETNALCAADRRTPSRRLFAKVATTLEGDGMAFSPILQVLTLTGWAPHASQSTPARPGSASVRLATALGTVEQRAGDTAQPAPSRHGR
jgi:SAM-dependent methyltransferase